MSDRSPTTKKYEELKDKHRSFVDFYLQCQNATEAARRAGYKCPEDSGYDLYKKLGPVIKEKMEAISNERILTAEQILEKLSDIAMGREKDAFGLDTSNQDKLKALELLGKNRVLFTDKQKVETELEINVSLTDDSESDEVEE